MGLAARFVSCRRGLPLFLVELPVGLAALFVLFLVELPVGLAAHLVSCHRGLPLYVIRDRIFSRQKLLGVWPFVVKNKEQDSPFC